MSDKNSPIFQPRARLLLQLGDKLLRNENIAVLELVKNSYDADASKVEIVLEKIDDLSKGSIIISDNGTGMSLDIIQNVWLEPGSDNKELQFNLNKRTKKYKRLPIGEKGIGRFGVHKLGDLIELTTKGVGSDEIVVKIDWVEFAKNKYLSDAKVDIQVRTPKVFKGSKTGTEIKISKLRQPWSRGIVRDLYRSIFTLNSPFTEPKNFSVKFGIDKKEWLTGLPKWDEIEKLSLFHFKVEVEGDSIKKFTYDFTPWENLEKLTERTITEKDEYLKNILLLKRKKESPSDEEEFFTIDRNYGTKEKPLLLKKFAFEGYIFDRDKKLLELSDAQKVSLLVKYLDEQGGVRVYRDSIRVNEYGERGNDWLNLDSRRVNVPAKRVSNSIILGVVNLNSKESTALIEKTNREGFIENDALRSLKSAILYVLTIIETLRDIDKTEIRLKYNPKERDEPVSSGLFELREIVKTKITDQNIKRQITRQIDKIEVDFNRLKEVLLTSAGAGLTFSVSIHEVEKIIQELNLVISKETVPARVKELIKHLDNLIDNYSNLLQQGQSKKESLTNLIKGGLLGVEYRLNAHKINLVAEYKSGKKDLAIICPRRLLLGALINILDNSIYWLDRKAKRLNKIKEPFQRKIYVDFFDDSRHFIDLLIADNGDGFSLPTSQMIKPFISLKPDGIGLGLHIVSEIMKSMNGELRFPEPNEYDIPKEFKKGAITVLRIRKG